MEAPTPSATPPPSSTQPEQDDYIPHEPLPKSMEERIFDELKKNPSFNKYRYALLGIIAFGGGALFGVGYLMFTRVLTLMDMVFTIALFVWATVFVNKRLNQMRAVAVEQIKREDEELQRKEEEAARQREYEEALAEYYRKQAENERAKADGEAPPAA